MPTQMREVCRAILEPSGEDLLRTLRGLYHASLARPVEVDRGEQRKRELILERLGALGLAHVDEDGARLTARGYLVANVAKEYCNWIDNGRQRIPPRPRPELVDSRVVVDIGCSYGRWLWEFGETAARAIGLEPQLEFIELGQALAAREGVQPPQVYRARAEQIDAIIAPQSADLVFARLVMTHVPIRSTLRKIARVLRPGGTLWVQVRSFGDGLRQMWRCEERLASRLFAALGVANSAMCMMVGKQICVPFPGRMHSQHRPAYPMLWWWRSALAAAGLEDFQLEHAQGGTIAFSARLHGPDVQAPEHAPRGDRLSRWVRDRHRLIAAGEAGR